MKKISLIKKLAQKRIKNNPILKRLGNVDSLSDRELMGLPEATIVSIVETYCDMKCKANIPDEKIFETIEAYRSMFSGAGTMPSPLTLSNYIKYRLGIEHSHGVPISDNFIDEAVEEAIAFFSQDALNADGSISQEMGTDEYHNTFIYKYGPYIVVFMLLISSFLNGGIAIIYFKGGQWFLGVWALLSVILLPKATLGLVLLLGRKSFVWTNMPVILRSLFSGTISKYKDYGSPFLFWHELLRAFVKEISLLIISLIPFIIFVYILYVSSP